MLKNLMPKTMGFFDLFERHAVLGLEAITTLSRVLEKVGDGPTRMELHRIEELEHQCDEIAHQAVGLLRSSFITPFDREEIRSLLASLDDVVDYVEAAAHRLELYEIMEVPAELVELSRVQIRAQEVVVELVRLLRNLDKAQNHDTLVKTLNDLENQGDRLHRGGIAALFRQKVDPHTLIKLKEVYEIMESSLDCAEDVGHVIEGIIIEHRG
ncbi:MAG: DUF47 domain-containing protein [Deltaproteobacteria bacterium]|nr:DUF47 domain-containing protein [Deltaproteobacteria bacterium]